MRRWTQGADVYERLRGDILSLRLKPGSVLNLSQLATMMQVSRSPIRDAVQQLRAEHLVDIFPQSGTKVARIDLEQVEVERILRATLECEAARRFCKHPDVDAVDKMRLVIEEQRWAANKGDGAHFLQLDDAFHEQVFSGSRLHRLWDIIQNQIGNYQRIRILSFDDPSVIPSIIETHGRLCDALEKGDADTAITIERDHVRKLDTEKKGLLEKHPEYFTTAKENE